MRMHNNIKVCFKNCKTAPLFYENQSGDYCLLSFPNQTVNKEFIFKEIDFWNYIKFKLKHIFKENLGDLE